VDAKTLQLVDKVVDFHGHLCPGVIMGVRAAQIALRELGGPSEDEELVAIVECDNCAVDGIQVLTGCTFGKGNLIFQDYGKTAFTFIRRSDGKAIRIAAKPGRREEPDSILADLREKVRAGTATDEEQLQFRELDRQRSLSRLEIPEEELFTVREVTVRAPRLAQLRNSVICEECGEPVMETRSRRLDGKTLCIPCFRKYDSR